MNEFDMVAFVAVGAVFPGAVADEESMQAALAQLSRDDALFACARLNAIVSGFGPDRSVYQRQYEAIGLLCSPQQKSRSQTMPRSTVAPSASWRSSADNCWSWLGGWPCIVRTYRATVRRSLQLRERAEPLSVGSASSAAWHLTRTSDGSRPLATHLRAPL
jgi:hypothetical protein